MNFEIVAFIVGLVVVTAVKWLIYTGLLWIMIKIQKMNYNWLGLLGSSALATLLNFIPVVGCYLGWAALVLCLWKVTGAEIAPDVIFTVAIAGAIMFCLNLWAFAALTGPLRPDLALASREMASEPEEEEARPTGNAFAGYMKAAADTMDKAKKLAADSTNRAEIPSMEPTAAPQNAPSPAPTAPTGVATRKLSTKAASEYGLALKGVMLNSKPSAFIVAGGKVYNVETGQVFSITTPRGKIMARCETIEETAVSLTLDKTNEVVLRIF